MKRNAALQGEKGNNHIGYDVMDNGSYVPTWSKSGIIDPAKVTKGALVENAASIASMILTTEALIADIPEKEVHADGPPEMPY